MDSLRYLGVIMNLPLKWDLRIGYLGRKFASSSVALCKVQHCGNVNLIQKTYFCVVCELHYAILNWGTANETLWDDLIE